MAKRVVIAGASHAGVNLADALRRQGHSGEIILLSAEEHAPYQRPLLSKAADYLLLPGDRTGLKASSYYKDNTVDLRLGSEVCEVQPAEKVVQLRDGSSVDYDELVLAVGAEPRRPPSTILAGLPPLFLRTMDDARSLHRRLEAAHSIAVVGGGLIGLEVAALARAMGRVVTVYEAAPHLLGRVIPQDLASFLLEKHRAAGIEILLSSVLVKLTGDDNGYLLQVQDFEPQRFDLVLMSIGSVPRTYLAENAGLTLGNGIAVDRAGRTSAQAIWAIGDCADWGGLEGPGQRFEGIQPATEQARIVAKAIDGERGSQLPVLRYWSHQGDLRLQTAGDFTPRMDFETLPAEQGGMCFIGSVNGVARGCFAVDAPNAYRDALKRLEAVRLSESEASPT